MNSESANTTCELVAFAAHPDDAELMCGGTLALAVSRGWKTAIVDFTRGELSTRGDVETRKAEAQAASDALGLSCRINLELPDGHLHDDDNTRRLVVRILRLLRPRVVIAPPLEDHHADHMAAAEVVSRSFYLAGVEKYADGEPAWRPNSLLHAMGSRGGSPHTVVDISSVYDRRIEAIRCYKSQFHNPGSDETQTRIALPQFFDWLEGNARHHGFLIGVEYGEGFTSPEPIPCSDPVEMFGGDKWERRSES